MNGDSLSASEKSADQIAWETVAESFRLSLEQRTPRWATFVEAYQLGLALNQAYWLQVNAQSYDEALGRNQRGDH